MANRDYDAKKYLCAPWLGQRGQPWVKDFKPAFENALKQKSDHFSTYYQCLFGMDFGGWGAGAPAHIMGAGALAGQNALSQQAILSRRDAILSLIKTHILNDPVFPLTLLVEENLFSCLCGLLFSEPLSSEV